MVFKARSVDLLKICIRTREKAASGLAVQEYCDSQTKLWRRKLIHA